MNKTIEIPDYLKELMATSTSDAGAMISTTSSVPRISMKGKKFTFIEDGEKVKVVNDKIHVIILGTRPVTGMAKTFYASGYQPNSSDPPDCSSVDGVVPDTWVSSPQSINCAQCKNNAWGSATSLTGKKAKACKESKRLMVVAPDAIADGTVWVLNVTISSLKALSEYGKLLVANNIPMAAAITTISLVDDSDFPQLEFSLAGILKKEVGMIALERAGRKEWMDDQLALPESPRQPQAALPDTSVKNVTGTVAATPVESSTNQAAVVSASDVDDLLNKWA